MCAMRLKKKEEKRLKITVLCNKRNLAYVIQLRIFR